MPAAAAGRSLAAASTAARSPTSWRNRAGGATMVDEPPRLGAVGAHPLGGGAEHVGEVAPHLALVDEPRQAAGARQHAEQRHFGQAHRARAVVDHDDLVAGERQLVAAAGAGAVDRGQEFEARIGARILDAVAGLVGEFAEIDLLRVARLAQHVDVGAGRRTPAPCRWSKPRPGPRDARSGCGSARRPIRCRRPDRRN